MAQWYQFDRHLNPENRWAKLVEIIPWDDSEGNYAKQFSEKSRYTALPVRMGLGTLRIQRIRDLSDRKTVEAIVESPYLQYFTVCPLGLDWSDLNMSCHSITAC